MVATKSSLISDFAQALRRAPLVVVCLLVYSALPSRFIFPPDFSLTELQAVWHPSLAGWYDVMLLGALSITWLVQGLPVDRGLTMLGYVCALAAVASLVFGYPDVSLPLIRDSAIYWLRWTALFCFAVWFAEACDARVSESLLVVICGVLCLSALFVYRLQFGINSRLFASAMSVASFSQVVVVALFIALTRKNYILMVLALPFLILSFSWTSILLFCLIAALYAARSKAMRAAQLLTMTSAIGVSFALGLYVVSHYPQFDEVRKTFTNAANAASLHGRTYIWAYGLDLLRSGAVGVFGIGLNRSPLLLHQPIIVLTSGNYFALERDTHAFPVHFHSILLEFGVGLGLPSLLLFYVLLKRMVQAFRTQCHLPWMIFTFFLLSQTLDFTIFRPKEIVLWALMLGLAEGQLRLHRGLLASMASKRLPEP